MPAVLLRADRRVELIRGLPLFELCSKRDLRRIAALADERELDAGTELIREGEPGSEFYVVVEGEIEVRAREAACCAARYGQLRRRDRTALALAADGDRRRDDAAPRAASKAGTSWSSSTRYRSSG